MYIHLLRCREVMSTGSRGLKRSNSHVDGCTELPGITAARGFSVPLMAVSSRPERPLFFPPVRRGGRVGGRGVEGPAVRRIGRISLYQLHRLTPVRGQVLPGRVLALDQPHLLSATPALQLLFPSDSVLDPGMLLVVNEAVDLVVAGKAANLFAAVLENSRCQVAGHADVQHPRLAGENVNVVAVLHDSMVREDGALRR